MIRLYSFVILSVFCLSSCQQVLLYSLGIRKPKEENKESISHFVHAAGLDTNDVYWAKDTSTFYKLNKISSSQSGYVFFNHQKEMLMYKDTGSACSAPVFLFAKNLCKKDLGLYYKKYDLTLITDIIKPLGEDIALINDAYDGHAVLFWAKYFGRKKFEEDIVTIVNLIKKNNCNIKIYLINLDLQQGWQKDIPINIGM